MGWTFIYNVVPLKILSFTIYFTALKGALFNILLRYLFAIDHFEYLTVRGGYPRFSPDGQGTLF